MVMEPMPKHSHRLRIYYISGFLSLQMLTLFTLRFCLFEFLFFALADSVNDDCQSAIYKCDSVAAQCFAKNKINPVYEKYPQRKCK